MEEVRVQNSSGVKPPVLRSVGPEENKVPQKAQEAQVEQSASKIEITSADAAVLTQSIKRVMSRVESGTEVKFSSENLEEAASGDINFQVVDKASGEVVRTFPSKEIERVMEASNSKMGGGVLIDRRV